MNKKYLTYSLIVLLILIFCTAFIPKVFENDLFFDLKTGEDILKYGIDFKDHFSFIPNLIYMYHHWLYDVIIYYVYSVFSYNGIFNFFLIIFVIFGFVVFCINNKICKNKVVSLIVTLFTIYVGAYAFQSRVQSITYIFFFLEIYFINKLYDTGEKRYSIYIIFISLLIANLHMPLWIFSVILVLPYLFEFIISKFKKIHTIFSTKLVICPPKNKIYFIITFVLMLITGLITPLKLYPYTFFIKSLFNDSYFFINEMAKTVLISNTFELYLILLFIIIMCMKGTKIRLSDLCLIVGLIIFSLMANRNAIYVYIFVPTLIVKILYEYIVNSKIKISSLNNFLDKFNKNCILIPLNIALLVGCACLINKVNLDNKDFGIMDNYPVETVKYIKQNIDYKNIKMYNDFNYGSYLALNDIPVFIDSRAEVYMKEFNGGKDIISDYLSINKYFEYKTIFKKYDFNYALVYNNSYIYYYLKDNDDYKSIFEESYYTLFKKCKSF